MIYLTLLVCLCLCLFVFLCVYCSCIFLFVHLSLFYPALFFVDLPLNRGLSHLIQLLSNEVTYSSPRLPRYVFGFREGWGDLSTQIKRASYVDFPDVEMPGFFVWQTSQLQFGSKVGRWEMWKYRYSDPFIHMAARNRFKLCYARLLSLKGHRKAQVDVVCLCVWHTPSTEAKNTSISSNHMDSNSDVGGFVFAFYSNQAILDTNYIKLHLFLTI